MEPSLLSGAAATALEARPGSASGLGRVLGPVSCVGDFSVFRHCLGWVRLIVSTGLRRLLFLVWDVMSVLSSALVPGGGSAHTVQVDVWSLGQATRIPGLGVSFAAAEVPP